MELDSCRAIRQKAVMEASASLPFTSPCMCQNTMPFLHNRKVYHCDKVHFKISGIIAYVHAPTVHSSNFTKGAVRILRFPNQKTDGATDDAVLDRHQIAGHCEHLGNIRRQP